MATVVNKFLLFIDKSRNGRYFVTSTVIETMDSMIWRLSEAGEDNLGLACTDEALVLGRTSLIEKRDERFVVRDRNEIERLLSRAYQGDLVAERLMSGLATVASALNANDPCLARIAAVHLRYQHQIHRS